MDADMNHSSEEIRNAALDVLSGRIKPSYSPDRYVHLMIGVAEVFAQQEADPGQEVHISGSHAESIANGNHRR
jgi:hypothetical protein